MEGPVHAPGALPLRPQRVSAAQGQDPDHPLEGYLRRRGGWSLLESLLSAFFIGLVVITACSMVPSGAFATTRAGDQLAADMVARSRVEELRAKPFPQLQLGSRAVTKVQVPGNPVEFTRTEEVFGPDGCDTALMKGIRVQVDWSRRDHPHSTSYEAWVVHVRQ